MDEMSAPPFYLDPTGGSLQQHDRQTYQSRPDNPTTASSSWVSKSSRGERARGLAELLDQWEMRKLSLSIGTAHASPSDLVKKKHWRLEGENLAQEFDIIAKELRDSMYEVPSAEATGFPSSSVFTAQ